MASFNRVILMGNLTRDPERRYTPKGLAVAEFSVAVNEYSSTETGERKEVAHFFDIVVFGKTAENCAQYLSKGRPVLLEGRLQQDRWEDKETHKQRSRVRILADRVQFIGGGQRPQGQEFREEAGDAASRGRQAAAEALEPPMDELPAEGGKKDDIPF
ncbi:MAG: single-stranded DNA-binding protein [Verrucomicrobiae bacterium]|nr:single-stranded DNA-binding protein [Verrucomicrobiae bacterium]